MDRASVDKLPPLPPVPTAAVLLVLKRASAYRYAAQGELPVQRLGGRVYIITARIRHLLITDDGEVATDDVKVAA
jgi:hypothetical protein